MPNYRVKIADREGRITHVVREASGKDDIMNEYTGTDSFVIDITQEKDISVLRKKKFSSRLLLEFTQTMHLLLESGLTVKDAFTVCRDVFDKGEPLLFVSILKARIDRGESLHEALSSVNRRLPPLFIGLVRIGEKIGTLDRIFGQLFHYLDTRKRMREKIINSLMYPVMVLSAAVSGIVFVFLFIVPKVIDIFSQVGNEGSDQITKAISGMKNMVITIPILIIITGILIFCFLILRKRKDSISVKIDSMTLSLPFIGKFLLNNEILNIMFSLEVMSESGITIEEALFEAKDVVVNNAVKAELQEVRELVLKGESLSRAILVQKNLPDRIGRWMGIGERTGKTGEVFGQLKIYYQGEVDRFINRFMNIVEPALILLVGAIMILMVVTFIIPIFNLFGTIL